jgi:hypothetical protein
MAPQPQPESVPTDELDRWLEGEIREAYRRAIEAVRLLLHTDQKWYHRPTRTKPRRINIGPHYNTIFCKRNRLFCSDKEV